MTVFFLGVATGIVVTIGAAVLIACLTRGAGCARAALLLIVLILGAGPCTVDRTADGWPGQRKAFEHLCQASRGLACFFAVLLAVLVASPARAEDAPTNEYGGCAIWADKDHTECALEAGIAAAVLLGRYQDGHFSAGWLPSLGYGLVLFPDRWYSVGLAGYGSLSVGANSDSPTPNGAALSGVLSFADYLRFGIGETWLEQPAGPVKRATALLFGIGKTFGGGPEARKAQKVEAW